MRRRGAGILMTGAAFAEIARPAFAGDQGDRRLHSRLGGLGRGRERRAKFLSVSMLQGLDGGLQRIDHRLVPDDGLAALLDASERSRQAIGPASKIEFG